MAEQWQDHNMLLQTAREFIEQSFDEGYELDITVTNLDSRLLLDACQGPLHAFLPYHKPPVGAVSVGVRCEIPEWKVHIPVQVRAYTEVMVTKQPITRGAMVTANDVQRMKREISRYQSGTYTDLNQVVDMVAKRDIRQDSVLTPRMLEPRRLVSRGQEITIIAELNGMQIRAKGEALMDGHQGQIIRAENSRSGKKISGEVIAPATIKVKM
jgi:flagella basal body P-ring formation protein FlgA